MTIVTDSKTRRRDIILSPNKSLISQKLINLIKKYETQHQVQVQTIKADKGTELINKPLKQFIEDKGIRVELTGTQSKPEHGIAERANDLVERITRFLIKDSGLSKRYWPFAAETAIYILNRCHSRSIRSMFLFRR